MEHQIILHLVVVSRMLSRLAVSMGEKQVTKYIATV